MSILSWKPIRRGSIYCAPACGHGCTWKAYQKAIHDSLELAKHLGVHWKPQVWENLGWHWTVGATFGVAHLSVSEYGNEFNCLISTSLRGAGEPGMYDNNMFSNPAEAVWASWKVFLNRAEALSRASMLMRNSVLEVQGKKWGVK